jgi:hypothetical protein
VRLPAAFVLLFVLAGCDQGELPFRQIQFCLNGENDIVRLKEVTRSIAHSNGLEFTDRSADAEAEAEDIKKSMRDMPVAHPTIVLSVDRHDGLGFGGGNFPDEPLQVSFGFSRGKNEAEARNCANGVVQRLSQFWVIHEVPNDRGAFPLKKCDYVTHSA